MSNELINNFKELKRRFKEETGLDADDNLQMYLSYYQAVCNDSTGQSIIAKLNELQKTIKELSDKLS